MRNYIKYLHTKLYMIEALSLKGVLAGDEKLKEIHDICIASPNKLQTYRGFHEIIKKDK